MKTRRTTSWNQGRSGIAARFSGLGTIRMIADSTFGRGQKTFGERTRTISGSARAWTVTESDP